MALRAQDIAAAGSDRELLDLLSTEISSRSGEDTSGTLDGFVAWLHTLPAGLRAMAATHQLDISMTMDDLGWHFSNWHNKAYCAETVRGLRELDASEAADIFSEACKAVLPYWDQIGELEGADFIDWYETSELQTALEPLNERMSAVCARSPELGLMSYWVEYARRHPERVATETPNP